MVFNIEIELNRHAADATSSKNIDLFVCVCLYVFLIQEKKTASDIQSQLSISFED